MATRWPDILDYRAWARIPDTDDDLAIGEALAATVEAIRHRCPILFSATPYIPDDAFEACLLWTRRLLARRSSPEGVIGVSDMGVATVGRWDPDVQRLLSPYVDPVLA